MGHAFDPNFGTAADAAAAIRTRQITSVELTTHTWRRIEAFQPALNAYVYELRDESLAAAARADEAIARGETTGPLHGVPVSVKESFGVEGHPCTWGMPPLKDLKAPRHSTAVRRLLDAGAVLLGATNVPFQLMDGQSFNKIYGTSNNPWDVTRTPGGSSGGAAAALAAGLCYFSTGSDIGGSIRAPASFCGIYGHKPTLDLVNMLGHTPGGAGDLPGFSTQLAVAGPMARSAEDLELGLRVIGGPELPDAKALQWTLPTCRHQTLRDFRIGYMLEDPIVPVSAETKAVLQSAIIACERAGATMKPGWPDGFRFQELLDTYFFHLGAVVLSLTPPEEQDHVRANLSRLPEQYAKGALSSFAEWQLQNLKRFGYRARWEKYFEAVDVFLLPTTFTAAFPHDHTPAAERLLPTPEGGRQSFWDLLGYITPATLTGCPATTAPVGLSKSRLPVGLQIMGPFLEDATTIGFARLLAQEIGGFQAPNGYGV